MRASVPWLKDLSVSGVWRVLQQLACTGAPRGCASTVPIRSMSPRKRTCWTVWQRPLAIPTTVALVFLDEMGYYRWPEQRPAGAPARPSRRRDRARWANNKQWRVIGALNALTGQVDYLENYVVGRRQVIWFYRQLDQRYRQGRGWYVVQDNWSIHHHPDVLAALTELPGSRRYGCRPMRRG